MGHGGAMEDTSVSDARMQTRFNKSRSHLKERLKAADTDHCGRLAPDVFLEVVNNGGLGISSEDMQTACRRFRDEGGVDYVRFNRALMHSGGGGATLAPETPRLTPRPPESRASTNSRRSVASRASVGSQLSIASSLPSHSIERVYSIKGRDGEDINRQCCTEIRRHCRTGRGLLKQFKAQDSMQCGKVSVDALPKLLRLFRVKISSEQAGQLSQHYGDSDWFDYTQFVKCLTARGASVSNTTLKAQSDLLEDVLRQKLNSNKKTATELAVLADSDTSYHMDESELARLVGLFGIQASAEAISNVFQKYDTKGNGLIPFQQFLTSVIDGRTVEERRPKMAQSPRRRSAAGELQALQQAIQNKIYQKSSMLRDAFLGMGQAKFGAGRNQIEKQTFVKAIKSFNLGFSDEVVNNLAQMCDIDDNGFIDYQEFAEILKVQDEATIESVPSFVVPPFGVHEDTEVNQMRLAQELMSRRKMIHDEFIRSGGKNAMSAGQFRALLRKLNLQISERDTDALISHLDTDGDGMIDFREFASAMLQTHHPIADLMKPKNLRASGDIIGWTTVPENLRRGGNCAHMICGAVSDEESNAEAPVRPETSNTTAHSQNNPLLIKPLIAKVRDHLDDLPSDMSPEFKYGMPSMPVGIAPDNMKELFRHRYMNEAAARLHHDAGVAESNRKSKKRPQKFHTRASLHRLLEIRRKYTEKPPMKLFKLSRFDHAARKGNNADDEELVVQTARV